MDKLNGCIFDWRWWLIRKLFGIKSVLTSKKNLIASLSIIKNKEFLKTKIKSHGDKVTDFYDKKFLR